MTTTLRYIGAVPTTFAEQRIGMVEYGYIFGVPNDQAESYSRRPDMEVVSVEPDETDPVAEPEEDTQEPESAAEVVADAPPTPDPTVSPEAPSEASEPEDEPSETPDAQ